MCGRRIRPAAPVRLLAVYTEGLGAHPFDVAGVVPPHDGPLAALVIDRLAHRGVQVTLAVRRVYLSLHPSKRSKGADHTRRWTDGRHAEVGGGHDEGVRSRNNAL